MVPIFHISPAGCGGGWTNDPCGPFEFKGMHHYFYQFTATIEKKGKNPGPDGPIGWAHVAGNLSHWHCLPPAIMPGVDHGNALNNGTSWYDREGIFDGAVTVVNGVPVAAYPGIGAAGGALCEASPLDLNDPLLRVWKKDHHNPMMRHMSPKAGTLGCTNGWQDPPPPSSVSSSSASASASVSAVSSAKGGAGRNWTTTIELDGGCYGACAVTFWTSNNYVNWSYIGNLSGLPPAFAVGVQDCSDFYPAPGPSGCSSPAQHDRWVFGDNRGGAITGTFDRARLNFRPDRPQLNSRPTDRRLYAYDFGAFGYPRSYEAADGRRIIWGWLGFGIEPFATASWWGLHSVPRVLTAAAPDDPTTALLMNPVGELTALRQAALLSVSGVAINGSATTLLEGRDIGRHFDAVVTFRGLSKALQNRTLRPNQNLCFAVLGVPLCWTPEPPPLPAGRRPVPPGWISGNAGGPMALRRSQDAVELRVLVDGLVMESFWDQGRARTTSPAYGPSGVAVTVSSGLLGVSVDVSIWSMGSAWIASS